MAEERFEKLKIPLLVGMVGHIDIKNTESEIAQKMEKFWKFLRELVGEETPIVLLTSIARGADHYAVKYRPDNVEYCVVLPFKQEEYEKDFKTDFDHKNFLEDLNGAYKVIDCHGTCEVGNRDYSKAAEYVRQHSDVMLTLWDGWESLKNGKVRRGGTYYQIRKMFNLDDYIVPHQEKAHLVINIPIERFSDHRPETGERKLLEGCEMGILSCANDENFNLLDMTPENVVQKRMTPEFKGSNDVCIADVLEQIKKHNEKIKDLPVDIEKTFYEENYLYEGLIEEPEAFRCIKQEYERYAYFDDEAKNHQKYHKRDFRWIAGLSILAGVCGQIWGDWPLPELGVHISLSLYLLLGLIALIFYKYFVKKKNHYHLYLEPRVIAELMRLKMFWKLAGMEEEFSSFILRKNANYWFAVPICNWDVWEHPLSKEQQDKIDSGEFLPCVERCWMNDQKYYYAAYLIPNKEDRGTLTEREVVPSASKTFPQRVVTIFPSSQERKKIKGNKILKETLKYCKKYERRNDFFYVAKSFCFCLGIFLAIFLVFVYVICPIFGLDYTTVWNGKIFRYREILIGICPFLVAVIGWYLEKKNWDLLYMQYYHCYCHFERGIKSFRAIEDKNLPEEEKLGQKRQVMKELMLLCHQENQEWNSIKNESQPEPMI